MGDVFDKIKGMPRKARPLIGGGALPKLENLQRKTADELVHTLKRFGLEPDMSALEKRANKAFERLDQILEQGGIPDDATWKAIDKSVEREVTQYLRQQTKAAVRNYRHAKVKGQAERFTWITVGDENVCPSCEPLHGKTKTMAQWEARGLPGTPAHFCGPDCRCQLLPDPHG